MVVHSVDRPDTLIGEAFLDFAAAGRYRESPAAKSCVVLGICIIGSSTSRGLGTKLMMLCEDEARRLGARKMVLTVWAANTRAWHVYQKVGFTTTKVYTQRYGDPEIRDPPEQTPGGVSDGFEMWKTLY